MRPVLPCGPEAVWASDLGVEELDDELTAAVTAATGTGIRVTLAGFGDAASAAHRLGPGGLDGLILADGSRALAVMSGRAVPVWERSGGEPFGSWLLDRLWQLGVGPKLVAVVGDGARSQVPRWARERVMRVDDDGSAVADLAGLLRGLAADRAGGVLPGVDESPGWHLLIDPDDERPVPVQACLLSVGAGGLGLIGDLEDDPASDHLTLAAGAYGLGPDGLVRSLPGPTVTVLGAPTLEPQPCRRVLDLHAGLLGRESVDDGLRSVRFVSAARPGTVAIRAEDGHPRRTWPPPLAPPSVASSLAAAHAYVPRDDVAEGVRADTVSGDSVVAAAAVQREWRVPGRRRIERIASVEARAAAVEPRVGEQLGRAAADGFDHLLDEHRRTWAQRWDDADIEIDGDPGAQLAARFALFHLLSCAATQGEAAVGARGLTGLAYAGHVFWDTDVFVLPALAATLPAAARAVLQYRINRLDTARKNAAERGLPGARFPWESATTGREVTPTSSRDVDGRIVPIRTGEREEHINADVAWALHHYLDWTGDTDVLENGGRDLVVDTARYWQARVRNHHGRGHLYGVIGPDEYHEIVDDNAYTNNLVRWHLRWAAGLAEAGGDQRLAGQLASTARRLVTGFDPRRGRHEQFAGFWELEPLLIEEIADPPVAADVLLGRDRIRGTQVVKQPDVLMLHHLLPEACPAGSARADLDFYLPRTAHGSSLSPAICAALLARDGRPDDAMRLFDIAARMDLDDLTGMTAGGLHLATMGGVWQAIVYGFAGIRPAGNVLTIDPHLPRRWERLSIRFRHRGRPVRVSIDHHTVDIRAERPVTAVVGGEPVHAPARVPYSSTVRSPDEP